MTEIDQGSMYELVREQAPASDKRKGPKDRRIRQNYLPDRDGHHRNGISDRRIKASTLGETGDSFGYTS